MPPTPILPTASRQPTACWQPTACCIEPQNLTARLIVKIDPTPKLVFTEGKENIERRSCQLGRNPMVEEVIVTKIFIAVNTHQTYQPSMCNPHTHRELTVFPNNNFVMVQAHVRHPGRSRLGICTGVLIRLASHIIIRDRHQHQHSSNHRQHRIHRLVIGIRHQPFNIHHRDISAHQHLHHRICHHHPISSQ